MVEYTYLQEDYTIISRSTITMSATYLVLTWIFMCFFLQSIFCVFFFPPLSDLIQLNSTSHRERQLAGLEGDPNKTHEAALFVNMKGCGYPPNVNCANWTRCKRTISLTIKFNCHTYFFNQGVWCCQFNLPMLLCSKEPGLLPLLPLLWPPSSRCHAFCLLL